MSDNIETTRVLKNEGASIEAADVLDLIDGEDDEDSDDDDERGLEMPEDCFLRDMVRAARRAVRNGKPSELIAIPERVAWRGEGSGGTLDNFLDCVVPCIKGELELIFAWESGDCFSGYVIRDGECVEHEVVLSLGKEISA